MEATTEPRKVPGLQDLLKVMIDKSGSDLHITAGSAPRIRIHGKLLPLDLPSLTPVETKQMTYSILADAQKHKFEGENELVFSFGIKGLSVCGGNLLTLLCQMKNPVLFPLQIYVSGHQRG